MTFMAEDKKIGSHIVEGVAVLVVEFEFLLGPTVFAFTDPSS